MKENPSKVTKLTRMALKRHRKVCSLSNAKGENSVNTPRPASIAVSPESAIVKTLTRPFFNGRVFYPSPKE